MTAPVLTTHRAFQVLGALGAIALVVSGFLVAADWLNHIVPSVSHLVALGLTTSITGLAGAFDKTPAPWFGWLAYGLMVASAVLGLPLGAAIAVTGKLPQDPNITEVLVVSLLLFAGALPAVLYARRRMHGPDL